MSRELLRREDSVVAPRVEQGGTVRARRVEIRKDVRPVETVRVSPEVYNALRSFVESSSKREYEWNVGYDVGRHVVFNKPRSWMLRVMKHVELPESPNIKTAVAELTTPAGRPVALYLVDHEGRYEVNVGGRALGDFDIVLPDREVPFARPIYGYEIRRKFEEYFRVA